MPETSSTTMTPPSRPSGLDHPDPGDRERFLEQLSFSEPQSLEAIRKHLGGWSYDRATGALWSLRDEGKVEIIPGRGIRLVSEE